MLLKDVLALSRVEINNAISAKKRLLEHVATLCAPTASGDLFFEALIEREKLGSTSLGHGVALPHARVAHLTQPVAMFIRLKQPIQYDSHDGEAVDLVFGLFVPQHENAAHLQLLSQVATCLNEESVRTALRHAKTPDELWTILTCTTASH